MFFHCLGEKSGKLLMMFALFHKTEVLYITPQTGITKNAQYISLTMLRASTFSGV